MFHLKPLVSLPFFFSPRPKAWDVLAAKGYGIESSQTSSYLVGCSRTSRARCWVARSDFLFNFNLFGQIAPTKTLIFGKDDPRGPGEYVVFFLSFSLHSFISAEAFGFTNSFPMRPKSRIPSPEQPHDHKANLNSFF